MSSDSVSVIVPVYNGSDHLTEALESVLTQIRPEDEVIVVDDGSTDATIRLAERFPVRIISQPNQGPAIARNNGILAATGKLIGFIDHDDLWPEGKLRLLTAAFQADPALEVVTGQYQLWLLNNGKHSRYGSPAFGPNLGSAFYRRHLFDSFGLLDAESVPSEDVDWYLRLREGKARIKILPDVVLNYRLHQTNLTGDRSKAQRALFNALKNSINRRSREADLHLNRVIHDRSDSKS